MISVHTRHWRLLALAFAGTVLLRCASGPAPEPLPATVGEVSLAAAESVPESTQLLDIGITVFTNPEPEAGSGFGDWVYTDVRENERHLLPFALRNTLIASNQWGVVRVLPEPDPSVDLNVNGSILASDGRFLELAIRVTDSLGRIWLDRSYADLTAEQDYPEAGRVPRADDPAIRRHGEPFQDLYDRIANDLLQARLQFSSAQLTEIRRVSTMVYATDLAPESFAQTLARDDEGLLRLASLPAEDDPMLRRVRDIRQRHHLFIDTVDEYYQTLFEDMQGSYLIWRRYSFDQEQEEAAALERAAIQERDRNSSGFLTLSQRYDRYRWAKIYEYEFRELALGFNREAEPAILELNRQVHGLSGTMEEQYIQWRRTLRQLFALESGIEADS